MSHRLEEREREREVGEGGHDEGNPHLDVFELWYVVFKHEGGNSCDEEGDGPIEKSERVFGVGEKVHALV